VNFFTFRNKAKNSNFKEAAVRSFFVVVIPKRRLVEVGGGVGRPV